MSPGTGIAVSAGACIATAGATLALRSLLIRRSVMDIPNERSSHALPVPRGGGAAFVLVIAFMIAAWWAAGQGADRGPAALAMLAMLGVATIGMIDDLRGLPPLLRLGVHLACAAVAVAAPVQAMAQALGLGAPTALALFAAVTLFAAWSVNMVNFMDGIDGIAAAEGTFVLACTGLLLLWADPSDALGWMLAAAAAAVLGFLLVNISRARIFMGDCGSGALGLLVAWALVSAVAKGTVSPWAAAALPAAFMADAGTTLAVRVAAGANPAKAHRTHAYQRAVRRGASHHAVTAAYCAVNLVLVAPVAFAAQRWPQAGPWLVTGLHAALVAAASIAGAGREPGPDAEAKKPSKSR
jgi:Fuc2NAc and GlcNAc transferase